MSDAEYGGPGGREKGEMISLEYRGPARFLWVSCGAGCAFAVPAGNAYGGFTAGTPTFA